MVEPSEHDPEEVGGGVSDLWLIVAGTFEASQARLYMPIEGGDGTEREHNNKSLYIPLGRFAKARYKLGIWVDVDLWQLNTEYLVNIP